MQNTKNQESILKPAESKRDCRHRNYNYPTAGLSQQQWKPEDIEFYLQYKR